MTDQPSSQKSSKLPQRLSAYAVYSARTSNISKETSKEVTIMSDIEPKKNEVETKKIEIETKKKVQKEVKSKVPAKKEAAKENVPEKMEPVKDNISDELPAKPKRIGRPKKKRDLNVTFEKEDEPAASSEAVKPKRKRNEIAKIAVESAKEIAKIDGYDLNTTFEKEDEPATISDAVKPKRKRNEIAKTTVESAKETAKNEECDLNATFEKEDELAIISDAVKPKRKRNEVAKNTVENVKGIAKIENSSSSKEVRSPIALGKFCTALDIESQNNFQHLLSNLYINAFDDSRQMAKKCFEWLIFPVTEQKFLKEIWENEPLFIKRNEKSNDYYQNLFSTKVLEQIIDNNDISYGVNLDVTKYENNERQTLNPEGRVYRSVIWDFYQNGASLRLLNPQSYSDSVWKLTSNLQEFFHTFVGANVYLTPPGSQGFAPHFDDIEAFILQLEGSKRWSVYKPGVILPRFSSPNFKREELGELILTVDLKPGDLLYLPRGFVHEAACINDEHSLHITISSTQLNTYADLLEKALPLALKAAVENDVEFRRSLPIDYANYMGVAYEEVQDDPRRRNFQTHINTLLKRLVGFLPTDGACDQMAKKFIHDSQPPSFSEDEKSRTIDFDRFYWNESKQKPERLCKQLSIKSQIRLVRQHCLRILTEGDNEPVVYYNVENSRIYHGKDVQKIDIAAEEAGAIEFLVKSYPDYCTVSSLPLSRDADKVALCRSLFELRLIMTKEPLEKIKPK